MRFIHFSDFHLYSDDRKAVCEENMTHMLNCFAKIKAEDGKNVDLVIFSGDLVNQGGSTNKKGIAAAFDEFQQIVIEPTLKYLGLNKDQFIFVPGNHDVNRNKIGEGSIDHSKPDVKEELDKFMKKSDGWLCHEGEVTKYILSGTAKEPQIEEFKLFEKKYYDSTGNGSYFWSPFESSIAVQIGTHRVGIAMLNSVWRCYDSNTDAGRILIGERQLLRSEQKLSKSDCDIFLAIAHHHPDDLHPFDQEKVKAALSSKFDFFFYGHTHKDDPYFRRDVHGEVLESGVGGTTPDNVGTNVDYYKNSFTVIDYDYDTNKVELKQYIQMDDYSYDLDRNYARGQGNVWKDRFKSSAFEKIQRWISSNKFESPYLCNDAIKAQQDVLLNPVNDAIELVALAGFGKTRFVYETFKTAINEGKQLPPAHYSVYHETDTAGLYDSLGQFFNDAKEAILIVDNCPHNELRNIVNMRGSKKMVKIIAINNEFFVEDSIFGVYKQKLEHNILKDDVEKYIRNSLQPKEPDSRVIEDIIMMSDGFPDMAYRFVREYKSTDGFNAKSVDDLVSRIVKFECGDMEYVMQTMSLFLPMPYAHGQKDFEFILGNRILNPLLNSKNVEECRRKFKRAVKTYEPELIELDSANLRVRPAPLAIWLASQWFKETDNDDLDIVLSELETLGKEDQHCAVGIIDAFAARLQYMQGNAYAIGLIDDLMSVKGSFHSEKVACSDMGSRLFLSMAMVNPVAVGKCLHDIVAPLTTDEVRVRFSGNARRYLTWTLESICYNEESYHSGFLVLARFALAENEDWGNNATAQLKQLFHVALPGTRCTLLQRLDVLRELLGKGAEYYPLIVDLCEYAFHNDGFARSGGVEPMGQSAKDDYYPTSKREVIDYWDGCRDLLVEILQRDGSVLPKVKKLLEDHAARWIFDCKYKSLVEPIYNAITKIDDSDWPELYNSLLQAKLIWTRRAGKNEDFTSFLARVRPNSFVTKVLDVINDYNYKNQHKSDTDRYEELQAQFMVLADEFLSTMAYSRKDEVEKLLREITYGDFGFAHCLNIKISDEQLSVLVEHILTCISENGEMAQSGFFKSLCYQCNGREAISRLYEYLRDKGYTSVYVGLLANAEDEQLTHLLRLKKEVSEGLLSDDFIDQYLLGVSMNSSAKFKAILDELMKDGNQYVDCLMNYAQRCLFLLTLEKDPELIDKLKELCLRYKPDADKGHCNLNFYELLEKILNIHNDANFVVRIHKKIVEALRQKYFHDSLVEIFKIFLSKYADVIWSDFSQIFINKDYFLVFWQVKDQIGSGLGFGKGLLFRYVSEDILKSLCEDNPDTTPALIAQIVPVFDQNSRNFSSWVMWLLDKFGNNKDVCSGIGNNLGTFSWTGSALPLYYQQRNCFTTILDHKYEEVRKWAQANIKTLDGQIEQEKTQEAFMRMRY